MARKMLTKDCLFCPHLAGSKNGLLCLWDSSKKRHYRAKLISTFRLRHRCNLTRYIEELSSKEKVDRVKYFRKHRLLTNFEYINYYISIRFRQLWTLLTITYLKGYLKKNFSR